MDLIQQFLKLIKINTKISALHSSDEILREIMNEAMSLTGTHAAFILQAGADRQVRCLTRFESKEEPATWSSSSALEAHDAQRLVYSTRALESSPAPSILAGSIQTLISAPLSKEDAATTVLQLVGRDPTSIDPQTISLLGLFVSQVQVTAARTKLEELAVRNAALAATGELAAQVAHDIRAPLAALEVAAKDHGLARQAIDRIREIADDLLKKDRAAHKPAAAPQLLFPLVEAIAAEKRAQFHARPGLEILFESASKEAAAAVPAAEFKRVLSNLIDNAVEAIGDRPGAVRVALSTKDGAARVSVEDNGKGIPPELLAKLGRRGETHGKPGGSGLGLYHARSAAESWGGRLELSSQGQGASAVLTLPSGPSGCDAVLIDDDPLARMTWRIAAEKAGKSLRLFAAPDDFIKEAEAIPRDTPVYLDVDLGAGPSGETESLRLHALGFRELYLATGHPPESFAGLSHLRGVVGKDPPWGR